MEDLFSKDAHIGAVRLDVYEFQSLIAHKKYGKDLFEGYDELYAITYSSGINFMSSILRDFKKAEIIFGYPPVLSKTQVRLVSFQLNVLKTLTQCKDALMISEMMEKGTVKLFTSDMKSHEKLYLLKGANKCRVILGSANMSSSSFNGLQREIIMFSDDVEVYDLMMNRYLFMREHCTSPISSDRIKYYIENGIDPSSSVSNAPVAEEVTATGKTKEFTEIPDNNQPEDFTLEINEEMFGDEKFDEFSSRPKITNGVKKSFMTPESIKKLCEKADSNNSQNSINPSMDIDYKARKINIGNYVFNLNPDPVDVKRAVDLVIRYFDGWELADAHAKRYRHIFWKLFVWYFSSPFIPYLRSLALEHHRDINFKYPMFSLLYGKSNCGKTKFLQFMTRLITGKDACILEGKNTTSSKLSKYKYNCRNLPLNIDEVSKSRWRSYSSLIKEDTFGFRQKSRSYAPVVFVTNEVESITMDLRKRCITLNLDSTIDPAKTIGNDNFIKILDSAFDNNALFSEFAARMFSQIDVLSSKIIQHEDTSADNILHSASVVLKDIFEENLSSLPEYIRELHLVGDYFNVFEMAKSALEALELGIKVEPELFTYNEKENLLVYKNPGISDKRLLDNIKNDLPPAWEAKVSLGALSMNLAAAREYFKSKLLDGNTIIDNKGINLLRVALKSEPEMFEIREEFLVYKGQQGDVSRLEDIRKLLPPDWSTTVTAQNLVIPLNKASENLDLAQIKAVKTHSMGFFEKLFGYGRKRQ